jgi:regulator of sigma D
LTQENLAKILEVAQQRVDEWEHGRKNMSLAYCKILGTIQPTLESLLGQAGGDVNKYRRLVLQAYGVEITDRHIKKVGA